MSISRLFDMSNEELLSVRGIGPVKAVQIRCLLEFSKRLWRASSSNTLSFTSAKACADFYMEELRHLSHEEARVLMLDNQCRMIKDCHLSVGTANSSIVSAREIFKQASKCGAIKVILVHNHPSGNPMPSSEDLRITIEVAKAGEIIDIKLLDSIIIGDRIYISLKEKGLLK